MSPVYVADAGALIAYLRNEPGADEFRRMLKEPGAVCYAHGANLAEVFYDFYRRGGAVEAARALENIVSAGILFREDFDRPFWEDAAWIKADYRRVSLAD